MRPPKLLLLDFDGTLCLGDDPVLAYADEVDGMLAQKPRSYPAGRSVREAVTAALEQNSLLVEDIQYDAAGTPLAVSTDPSASVGKAHPVSWPLQDGYQLVQLLAAQAGLTNEETGLAFRQARQQLLSWGLHHTDVHAPAEAADLISEVRASGVSAVLATNAPAEGFGVWLQALGLHTSFDAVINSAQKPFGMPQTLEQARVTGAQPVPQTQVLSVGDIWANDLAHVDALGGTTVLIDRFATGLGDPDHRVESFARSAPIIRSWSD